MKTRLRDLPLFYQISLVISLISISISLIMVFSLPSSLRSFFTREIYSTISAAQNAYINPQDYNKMVRPASPNLRTVNHILLYENGNINLQAQVPLAFIQRLELEAANQKEVVKNYSYSHQDFNVFYAIRKVEVKRDFFQPEEGAYLISFLYNSYRDDLVAGLFIRLSLLSILILLASFIPAFLLSKYLSRPLVLLESKVKKLGDRQWQEPISMNRQDEIGQLGQSIELLRLELLRQENLQANFLQNISHDLKTPIMVIQSYSQAIRDGIYPAGNMASSLDIISSEAKRLEDKVQSLLYLTKLDYMESQQIDRAPHDLSLLLDQVLSKYRPIYPQLEFINTWPSLIDYVDGDQFQIVIENLLDNMVRYAQGKIEFSQVGPRLVIANDGPAIENINHIFQPFHKGPGGQVGLGLAIVDKLIRLHGWSISAENTKNRVCFYIDRNKE